jgi:hypothetical protein
MVQGHGVTVTEVGRSTRDYRLLARAQMQFAEDQDIIPQARGGLFVPAAGKHESVRAPGIRFHGDHLVGSSVDQPRSLFHLERATRGLLPCPRIPRPNGVSGSRPIAPGVACR